MKKDGRRPLLGFESDSLVAQKNRITDTYLTDGERLDAEFGIFAKLFFSAGNLFAAVRQRVKQLAQELTRRIKTMKTPTIMAVVTLLATLTAYSNAQDKRNNNNRQAPDGEKIAWYSTLDSALAEAERTEKPILLIAARPECQGVPGKW